ncbi:MAG: hypothetical protein AB1331_07810 [Bacillota bacterium]
MLLHHDQPLEPPQSPEEGVTRNEIIFLIVLYLFWESINRIICRRRKAKELR